MLSLFYTVMCGRNNLQNSSPEFVRLINRSGSFAMRTVLLRGLRPVSIGVLVMGSLLPTGCRSGSRISNLPGLGWLSKNQSNPYAEEWAHNDPEKEVERPSSVATPAPTKDAGPPADRESLASYDSGPGASSYPTTGYADPIARASNIAQASVERYVPSGAGLPTASTSAANERFEPSTNSRWGNPSQAAADYERMASVAAERTQSGTVNLSSEAKSRWDNAYGAAASGYDRINASAASSAEAAAGYGAVAGEAQRGAGQEGISAWGGGSLPTPPPAASASAGNWAGWSQPTTPADSSPTTPAPRDNTPWRPGSTGAGN